MSAYGAILWNLQHALTFVWRWQQNIVEEIAYSLLVATTLPQTIEPLTVISTLVAMCVWNALRLVTVGLSDSFVFRFQPL